MHVKGQGSQQLEKPGQSEVVAVPGYIWLK